MGSARTLSAEAVEGVRATTDVVLAPAGLDGARDMISGVFHGRALVRISGRTVSFSWYKWYVATPPSRDGSCFHVRSEYKFSDPGTNV